MLHGPPSRAQGKPKKIVTRIFESSVSPSCLGSDSSVKKSQARGDLVKLELVVPCKSRSTFPCHSSTRERGSLRPWKAIAEVSVEKTGILGVFRPNFHQLFQISDILDTILMSGTQNSDIFGY